MAELLSTEEVQKWIADHSGWKRKDDTITKEYVLGSFRDSIVFMNRIASIADDLNHHPDIDIRYNKVRLTMTTHDAGGLTKKDLTLAQRIDVATSAR